MKKELSYEGYRLVWEEQFQGDTLNPDDWNVELHEPGWVNEEWQEYIHSSENIYLKDGKLCLRAIKSVNENGEAYYTSGRVSTQYKHDFTYGIFESRLKVPKGKGFLPAFWLMTTDEDVYGQWPRCGEIDIMEVLGHDTVTNHGTIHYGIPHQQGQGKYTLEQGSFADDFHTLQLEWEPGKLSWYVDGELYHVENDWYCAREKEGKIPFPAPFNHPFYIILNLAVGGSWVGYPDESTDFEDAVFEIDYVKVYQK